MASCSSRANSGKRKNIAVAVSDLECSEVGVGRLVDVLSVLSAAAVPVAMMCKKAV
jgi:hypothetical protein